MTIPESYFPLTGNRFEMKMGTRPLAGVDALIEFDPTRYVFELGLKRSQFARDRDEYIQLPETTRAAQWEAACVLVRDVAAHPNTLLTAEISGAVLRLTNHAMQEQVEIQEDDAVSPLESLAMHVQEDLCLMDTGRPGAPLVAGLVAFPADWSMREKVGLSFGQVHGPVPMFADVLETPTLNLMQRMRWDRPVWRPNWGGMKPHDQMDCTPQYREWQAELKRAITLENAGTSLFFRVERQTLTRLPATNTVLFTIHTYLQRFDQVCDNLRWAQATLGWLQTAPAAWLAYKGMQVTGPVLQEYLAKRIQMHNQPS